MKKIINLSIISAFLIVFSAAGFASAAAPEYCINSSDIFDFKVCAPGGGCSKMYYGPRQQPYYGGANYPLIIKVRTVDGDYRVFYNAFVTPSNFASGGGLLAPPGNYLVKITTFLNRGPIAVVTPDNPAIHPGESFKKACLGYEL